jgi:hypothetical protein
LLLLGVGLGAVAWALLVGGTTAQTLTIDNTTLSLVSSTRVSLTLFDLTYRATVTNTGTKNMAGVAATLTSLSPHTVVRQGSLTFGNVPAGHSVISANTFTIRQDRSFTFHLQDLVWQITGTVGNSPPVANAGPAQTVFVGTTVSLDGSQSSDIDGDPLTYHWVLMSIPPGSAAILSNPTAVHPTFVVDHPGAYTVQLVVNDGKVDSAPATVVISTQNSPPVAHAGPNQTVFVGTTVRLDGSTSSDVDGDALTFHWSLTSVPVGSTVTLSDPSAVTRLDGRADAGQSASTATPVRPLCRHPHLRGRPCWRLYRATDGQRRPRGQFARDGHDQHHE